MYHVLHYQGSLSIRLRGMKEKCQRLSLFNVNLMITLRENIRTKNNTYRISIHSFGEQIIPIEIVPQIIALNYVPVPQHELYKT